MKSFLIYTKTELVEEFKKTKEGTDTINDIEEKWYEEHNDDSCDILADELDDLIDDSEQFFDWLEKNNYNSASLKMDTDYYVKEWDKQYSKWD